MSPDSMMILMVEDDEGHAKLIERNLRRAAVSNEIMHFDNGQKIIDYLFDQDGYKKHRRMLVLLDINLPGLNGHEVLKRLKNDPRTHSIPVIMLTTTDDPREIEYCYELGCNVYITKPVDYDNFADAIRKLGLMLEVVKIPGLPA